MTTHVVSRHQYGDQWPFTVDAGILRHWETGPNKGALTFTTRTGILTRRTYALNGVARTRIGKAPGWHDIQGASIWLYSTASNGYVPLTPLFEKAGVL